jgi:RNA polymerase sigma factor (sigma-70 family)
VKKEFSTDTALLEGLALGSQEAATEIYRLYRPMLAKWLKSKGGKDEDTDDIFQDVLMILLNKAKDPEFCLTCKLSTYLFAISKRLWYKKLQRDANIFYPDMDEEDEHSNGMLYDEDINGFLVKEAQFGQLSAALIKLGEPCSSLLKAFYFQNKGMQEIAQDFQYTNPENAKNQKYKCLMRLRKIFFEKNVPV